MKRYLPKLFIVVLAALGLGCPTKVPAQTVVQAKGVSAEQARQLVGASSQAALQALKQNDTRALSRYVHPVYGVRISPYVNANKQSDLVFKKARLARLQNNQHIYNWGTSDGSGDPIRLKWNVFRTRYLVPANFGNPRPNFNRFQSRGNLINNLATVYPQAIFVEYYRPGINPQYGGMDWRGVWFVWRPVGKQWFLVGIAGDQWTT